MTLKVLALACAFAGVCSAQEMRPWTCSGNDRWACDMGAGCKAAGPSPITVKFDFNKPAYERCDASGCDVYTPQILTSGDYLLLELSGRATFAKIGPTGSFTEVVSLGSFVAITYGFCQMDSP